MAKAFGGAVAAALLMVLLMAWAQPSAPGQRSQTLQLVGMAIDADAAARLEAGERAHIEEMARIEAERQAQAAEALTVRLAIVAAGAAVVAVFFAAGVILSRLPRRVVVVHRLAGADGRYQILDAPLADSEIVTVAPRMLATTPRRDAR